MLSASISFIKRSLWQLTDMNTFIWVYFTTIEFYYLYYLPLPIVLHILVPCHSLVLPSLFIGSSASETELQVMFDASEVEVQQSSSEEIINEITYSCEMSRVWGQCNRYVPLQYNHCVVLAETHNAFQLWCWSQGARSTPAASYLREYSHLCNCITACVILRHLNPTPEKSNMEWRPNFS